MCCRDQAPWQARAATFAAVVDTLGQCMATRYTAFAQDLWRTVSRAQQDALETHGKAADLPGQHLASLLSVLLHEMPWRLQPHRLTACAR